LQYLAAQPAAALGAVTAFHLIEHFNAAQRLALLRGAQRALASGGWLIMEWPNAAHPRVAQYTFWLDPTHQSLLPIELATFMAEFAGFSDIETIRLDEGQPVAFEALDIALRARKP